MAPRYDDDREYTEWEDDPEGPQDDDLTDDEDGETPTVPCTHCRRDIPDFADRCPYCGAWVVQSAGATRPRPWIYVVVAVLLGAILLFWVLR